MTTTSSSRDSLAERFTGAILGTAFGDALGAGVEGWSAGQIESEFGEVRDYIDARLGAGCYTDDTQLTLATARSIVRMAKVDGADCAKCCAEMFDPERGYGRSAIDILKALAQGADHTETGTMIFPEGSYGNGAAMRISPVGLFCGTMEPNMLRFRVFDAVQATHVHDEAIDGALMIAAAVGYASRLEDPSRLNGSALLLDLSPYCRTMELRSRIMLAARMLDEEPPRQEIIDNLGNGVRTLESVPIALYAALKYADDPEQALIRAVGYGGDTDTIAAMTGAVVGALHGAASFPERWHEGLERGEQGYDALVEVAEQLAGLCE